MAETSACFALYHCPERAAFVSRFLADVYRDDERVRAQVHAREEHLPSGGVLQCMIGICRTISRDSDELLRQDGPARDPVERGTRVRFV